MSKPYEVKVNKLTGKEYITFFARRTSGKHNFPYGPPYVNKLGQCEFKAALRDGQVKLWVVMGRTDNLESMAFLLSREVKGLVEGDFAGLYELAKGLV